MSARLTWGRGLVAPAPVVAHARATWGRGLIAASFAVALAFAHLPAVPVRAEPSPEPPPEEPDGTDYEIEPADSIAQGSIELGVGASGRMGARPRQTRRVRFSDRTLGGSVREGEGDPLAGGSIESQALAGRLGVGRLAPRWGRGLVLGAAAEAWSTTPSDRGAGAPFRGRAGRGAYYQLGEGGSFESIWGRFAQRELAGARFQASGLGLGTLADRSGHAQTSLSLSSGGAEHELALDRSGRWRFESALERAAGPVALVARVRGGLASFRSLAEPRRNGPPQVLAMGLSDDAPWARIRALGALWRFRPGLTGARAVLEVQRRLNQHGSLAAGFEERHGTQRESGRSPGFRQGAWGEWRGAAAGLALALRHEVLGARRLGRDAVRTVTAVRIDWQGPAGAALRVTHCTYRVRPGESLYLAEAASDRVVLRAVSGTGRRTRVEVRAPGAGGQVRAALEVPLAAGPRTGGSLKPQWTLDWTRRARSR